MKSRWRQTVIGLLITVGGVLLPAGEAAGELPAPAVEPPPVLELEPTPSAGAETTSGTGRSTQGLVNQQLDAMTHMLGGPMAGEHPGQPAPLAGIDLYWRRFWDKRAPSPPADDPYSQPWAALQQRTHRSLIHEPADARTAAQAVEYLPGGTLIEQGARGTAARWSALGADPVTNRFTIEGANATMPDGGFPYLASGGYTGLRLRPDRYAEVWHAIGGVVNFAAPEPEGYNGVRVSGGAGLQGVWTQQVAANLSTAAAMATVGEESEARRANSHDNSGFRMNSQWLRVEAPVGAGQSVAVSGQRLEMRRGWYESNNLGLGAVDDPNDTQRYRVTFGQVESLWQPDEELSFHIAVHGMEQQLASDETADAFSFIDQQDVRTLVRSGLRAQLAWTLANPQATRVRVRASVLAESEVYKRPVKAIERHGQTALGQLAVELGNADWLLFDLDVTAYAATDIGTTFLPGMRVTVPVYVRGEVAEERLELVFGWSRALAAPSYEQRYLNDFTQVGNRDLKAEQAERWQAGVQYRCPFAEAAVRYEYRHSIDQIVVDSTSFPFTWRNRSGQDVSAVNVHLKTFPVESRFQPLRLHVPFFFDWTYVRSEDADGRAVIDRPTHDIKLGYEVDAVLQRAEYAFAGQHPDVAGKAPPYLCRLGAQWHYRDGWKADLNEPPLAPFYSLDGFVSCVPVRVGTGSIEARIDARNLTKRRVMTDLGHRSESLTWIAGVQVNWTW